MPDGEGEGSVGLQGSMKTFQGGIDIFGEVDAEVGEDVIKLLLSEPIDMLHLCSEQEVST